MDRRKFNGGHSSGGRKSKSEEQKLIESLTPLNKIALKSLETALINGNSWAVKLFFEYFYGKPKNQIDINTTNNDNKEFDYSKLSTSALIEIANL